MDSTGVGMNATTQILFSNCKECLVSEEHCISLPLTQWQTLQFSALKYSIVSGHLPHLMEADSCFFFLKFSCKYG